MGCRNSTTEELTNKDINVRHRFLIGVHVSKDADGIEGNVQIALETIRKEKYERVPLLTNDLQDTSVVVMYWHFTTGSNPTGSNPTGFHHRK